MPMPAQTPGRSKQDYGTPPEFIEAAEAKLGINHFSLDIAASHTNFVCEPYYTEEVNAFTQPWGLDLGWSWLNPPFAKIGPWVKNAWNQSQAHGHKIAVLVPAAVGSNWWRDWVHSKAHVLLLNGRLTFVGETTPYPKDCALLLYNSTYVGGYNVWTWRS